MKSRRHAAWLFGILCSLTVARTASAAPPAAESAAVERYQRGKKLAQDHRCREAIVEFQASLDLMPSPNTRMMLARCYLELGQIATAHVLFERAAHEARDLAAAGDARYQATATAAFADADTIAKRVPRITLVLPPDAPQGVVLALDGQALAASGVGTPMELDPGPHVLDVRGAGIQAHQQRFEAHELQEESVNIVVERIAQASGGGQDAWDTARARAAAGEEGISVEELRDREQRRETERQAVIQLRPTWRFGVGVAAGAASGNANIGTPQVVSGFFYEPDIKVFGPDIEVYATLRKGLSPHIELVTTAGVGTARIDDGYEWSTSPLLIPSLAVGGRYFLAEYGHFFLGGGARVLGVYASVSYSGPVYVPGQGVASTTASSSHFSIDPGGYLEAGWSFGSEDDWVASLRTFVVGDDHGVYFEFPGLSVAKIL